MRDMYGIDYYEKMLKLYSQTGEMISKIRWHFLSEIRPKLVLDYGAGLGWFRAIRPFGVEVDSYDIDEFPVKHTGILHDKYDVICMWDVLEHIINFSFLEDLFKKTNYIALTYPILPEGVKLAEWFHFKPLEHVHYLDTNKLETIFTNFGFKLLKNEMPECPPRKDIHSFLFEKI